MLGVPVERRHPGLVLLDVDLVGEGDDRAEHRVEVGVVARVVLVERAAQPREVAEITALYGWRSASEGSAAAAAAHFCTM